MTRPKIPLGSLEILRPLLQAHAPYHEMFIDGLKSGPAICTGCGATDRKIMIRKHKKNCRKVAYYKAMDALTKMLAEDAELEALRARFGKRGRK